jgi:CHASE3 domain sensor protein
MYDKLKISSRLSAGFAVTLLLIAGLGVFTVHSGKTVESTVEDLRRSGRSEVLIEQVQKRVFQSRYLATGAPENSPKTLDALRTAREGLAELAALSPDSERSVQIARLDTAIAAYRDKAAQRLDTRWALRPWPRRMPIVKPPTSLWRKTTALIG